MVIQVEMSVRQASILAEIRTGDARLIISSLIANLIAAEYLECPAATLSQIGKMFVHFLFV